MTAHMHREITPGCYRCDLNLDEVRFAEREAADQFAREEACPSHIWRERVTKFDSWAECTRCGREEER